MSIWKASDRSLLTSLFFIMIHICSHIISLVWCSRCCCLITSAILLTLFWRNFISVPLWYVYLEVGWSMFKRFWFWWRTGRCAHGTSFDLLESFLAWLPLQLHSIPYLFLRALDGWFGLMLDWLQENFCSLIWFMFSQRTSSNNNFRKTWNMKIKEQKCQSTS